MEYRSACSPALRLSTTTRGFDGPADRRSRGHYATVRPGAPGRILEKQNPVIEFSRIFRINHQRRISEPRRAFLACEMSVTPGREFREKEISR
jgi:hypothetical protein